MRAGVNFFDRFSAFTSRPLRRRLHIGGAVQRKSRKLLQEANQVESGFMVCKLSNVMSSLTFDE